MHILVTGATGFIGENLVRRLLVHNHQVTGTARHNSANQQAPYTFLAADLAEVSDCVKLCQNIDVVVHCAGKAGVWGDADEYIKANLIATKNILNAAKMNGVKRFINISSPSIYFQNKHQILLKETDLPEKISDIYALTKFQAEQLVQEAHTAEFLTLSLRPRGVIGAGDRNWLPRIIEMKKSGRLVRPGDGDNLADFTCIDNLLDVIELCLTTSADNFGDVYNISNGSPDKLWSVITQALELVGLSKEVKGINLSVAMSVARLSELFHKMIKAKNEPALLPIKVAVAAYSMTLDISKAKEKLGYSPRKTTFEGLQSFAHWYVKQKM